MTDIHAGQSADERTIRFLQSAMRPLCRRPGHHLMPAHGKRSSNRLDWDEGLGVWLGQSRDAVKTGAWRWGRWYMLRSLLLGFGVLTTVKCVIDFIWGIRVPCVCAKMPDVLCFRLRCVLCQLAQWKERVCSPQNTSSVCNFFACSCTSCTRIRVYVCAGCGGPHMGEGGSSWARGL